MPLSQIIVTSRYLKSGSARNAIEDDYNKSHKKLQSKIDSKLQHMIRKHKQELGIRDDHGQISQS